MATVPGRIDHNNNAGTVQIVWETLTDGDDGGAVDISSFTDLTVHSDGDYSGSATITMQGSNNNVAWFSLSMITGGALATAAAALTADTVGGWIVEEPRYIRPLVNSGDGSTDIDVTVSAKLRAY